METLRNLTVTQVALISIVVIAVLVVAVLAFREQSEREALEQFATNTPVLDWNNLTVITATPTVEGP
ncbi:MAG: hypothetical protein ACOCYT_02335 [Chloroflexota bacterium]